MNDQIEKLLPLACAWVQEQEALILKSGVPLNESQLKDAALVGVQHPEKIRVLITPEFPQPEHGALLAAGQKAGLFGPQVAARCCRYGICVHANITDKDQFREFLIHECVHTSQYERQGGIEPHIRALLEELQAFTYPSGPMEQEARTLSKQIVTDRAVNFAGGWFDTPMRRDPELVVKPEWEKSDQSNKCAHVFLGVLHHDDSVTVRVVRVCDPFEWCDHNQYGETQKHGRFRWHKVGGLRDGYGCPMEISTEQKDKIESAIQRKVNLLKVGVDPKQSYYLGYNGIRWKSGGADRQAGVSCTGLVWLWLNEQKVYHAPAPCLTAEVPMECSVMPEFKQTNFERGDVVFFRDQRSGKLTHCAVCVGTDKYLHIVRGCGSRIENGFVIFKRLKLDVVGALSPRQAHDFYLAVEREHLARAGQLQEA